MSAWFRENKKRVPTEQDLIGARDAVLRAQRTCKDDLPCADSSTSPSPTLLWPCPLLAYLIHGSDIHCPTRVNTTLESFGVGL